MADASFTTDYTELHDSIPVTIFARNADLIAAMPRVIARAEQRVIRRLDHEAFRTAPELVTIPPTGLYPLPDSLLELRAVQVQLRGRGWTSLRRRSEEMLETMFASRPPGLPAFYAQDSEENIVIYPKPMTDTTARITYNRRPDTLSSGNPTNILTDRFAEVLWNATAFEGAIFMDDEGLKQYYANDLESALQAANISIARQRRDESATRPMESINVKG